MPNSNHCPICGRKLAGSIPAHMSWVHKIESIWTCPDCGHKIEKIRGVSSWDHGKNIQAHFAEHRDQRDANVTHTCENCGEVFDRAQELYSHIDIHRGLRV